MDVDWIKNNELILKQIGFETQEFRIYNKNIRHLPNINIKLDGVQGSWNQITRLPKIFIKPKYYTDLCFNQLTFIPKHLIISNRTADYSYLDNPCQKNIYEKFKIYRQINFNTQLLLETLKPWSISLI